MLSNDSRIISRLITRLKDPENRGSHLIVATHNEKSIRIAAQTMKDLNVDDSAVSFAQIYGMGDYLSAPLGNCMQSLSFLFAYRFEKQFEVEKMYVNRFFFQWKRDIRYTNLLLMVP